MEWMCIAGFCSKLPSYLKPGGVLLMEVGSGQAASVCRQAEESGWFRTYDVLRDEGGIDRVVCFEKKEEARISER